MKQKNKERTGLLIALAVLLLVILAGVFFLAMALEDPWISGGTSPAPENHATGSTMGPETTVPTEPPIPLNPYTPEDFVLENGYMTCAAGDYMHGIDVSFWQGEIEWQKVKESGVEFVMVRLGSRGSEQGVLSTDDNVYQNLNGAREAGLLVGGYFFSQAISVEEAVEEAHYVLDILNGFPLDMPVVFDWEFMGDQARTYHVGAELLTACTKTFCDVIEGAGYEAMVYFNPMQAKLKVNLEELVDYHFWLAMYDTPMDYPYQVDMWQYSCTGSVPGIQGDVDLNLYLKYD